MIQTEHRLVNLTPHDLPVFLEDGTVVTIPVSGEHSTVITEATPTDPLEFRGAQIPCYKTSHLRVEGLPEPREGVLYIVSNAVAQLSPERSDLVVPYEHTRGEDGRVNGCRAFAFLTTP